MRQRGRKSRVIPRLSDRPVIVAVRRSVDDANDSDSGNLCTREDRIALIIEGPKRSVNQRLFDAEEVEEILTTHMLRCLIMIMMIQRHVSRCRILIMLIQRHVLRCRAIQ